MVEPSAPPPGTHRVTIRLDRDTWEGLKPMLAIDGVSAAAFFEAIAELTVESGADVRAGNGPDAVVEIHREIVARARAIDVERRMRGGS